METGIWWVAVLLLTSGTVVARANTPNALGCDPESNSRNRAISVFYTTSVVPRGCKAHGPADPDLEVHILNLRFSKPMTAPLLLNVSTGAAKGSCKTVLVLNSNSAVFLSLLPEGNCRLAVVHAPGIYLISTFDKTNTTNLPSSSDELMVWARDTYSAVSSFAELEDPKWIHFQVGGDRSANKDCVLTQNFNAETYLEMEVVSHKVETCLDNMPVSEKVAHILWLQQSSSDDSLQAVELNVKMLCSDGRSGNEAEIPLVLWLKSHQKMLWKMGRVLPFVQLLASGKYSLKLPNFGVHNGMILPDTKKELIRQARNNSFVASYTEIPSAKSITLEYIRICGQKAATTTKPPQNAKNLTNVVHQLINFCKPWKCWDGSIEIAIPKVYLEALAMPIYEITLKDPSCRARDNSTHFVLNSILDKCSTQLEGGIHAKNQLILTLSLFPDKVTVPFECDLPDKLYLQLYDKPDFQSPITPMVEAHQVTYVEVSLRTATKHFSLEIGDCSLQIKGNTPQLLIQQGRSLSYSVEFLKSPSPKTRRFSFIYKPEEEMWSIESAVLACTVHLDDSTNEWRSYQGSLEVMLKNFNTRSQTQGLKISTVLGIAFGAFLIGVLLTAALWYIYSHTRPITKTPPVPANPPVSESSSTNHSLGSTQSTPCSTSSMA